MNNKNTILILAPHTDDGELGCGGLISKMCEEGKNVYYVAFSSCSKSLPENYNDDTLKKEVAASTKALGIPEENLFVFDYEVRMFKNFRQEILEELVKLRSKINPDLVFTPSQKDIHQDHQVISEETIRTFKNISILGYEMPWNNLSFNTSCFMKLNDEHVKTKINSLAKYESQKGRTYFEKDYIEALARTRGVQISAKYAEVFEVIRWII